MTFQEVKSNGTLLLKAISGSRAYGLETPTSDTDIKGVFVLPQKEFFGLNYTPQVSDTTNDEVYFEIGRYVELLVQNNPNIIELMHSPSTCVLLSDPTLALLRPEMVLSKLCQNSFGKFAISQMKKAKGLNKKILNPMEKERKSVLDFCFITQGQQSVSLFEWLKKHKYMQENCGLVNVPHMKNVYALFYDSQSGFNGIIRSGTANEVCLSSIPKEMNSIAYLFFNQDGYSTYCKKHKEYWDWVAVRNEARYQNTAAHGRRYDSKNMMHTFRLLDMATEIAQTGRVNVSRPNRDFLLSIKAGEYEYEDLEVMANKKAKEMELAFGNSILPEKPNAKALEQALVEIRSQFYP